MKPLLQQDSPSGTSCHLDEQSCQPTAPQERKTAEPAPVWGHEAYNPLPSQGGTLPCPKQTEGTAGEGLHGR